MRLPVLIALPSVGRAAEDARPAGSDRCCPRIAPRPPGLPVPPEISPSSAGSRNSAAATATAPPGSATSRPWRARRRTASSSSASLTVTMSSTSALICGKVSSPTCSTRSESALVLAVSAAAQATRAPLRSDSRASAANSGSTPMTRVPGSRALTATAMPDTSPPPPTGTRTAAGRRAPARRDPRRSPGRSCPARRSRAGRRTAGSRRSPGRSRSSPDASIRAASVGATVTSSAPTPLIRSVLTGGAVSGTTIAAGMREQRGGVGDGESVIAARVRDHARRPRVGQQRRDRVVGAAELERAGRLERLGLDQQGGRPDGRRGTGKREQRRPNRHSAQPLGGGAYLIERNEISHLVTLVQARHPHTATSRYKYFASHPERPANR